MKALIAMSGGVDSSLAAKIMKDRGFECIGCTMKLYDNADAGVSRSKTCCSLDDVEDARSVAHRLGMKYYVFNFTDDFRRCVIEKFARCYETGITPNPCIDCNRYMKFEKLLDRAKILGCDYLVTGHYARIEKSGEKYVLKKALDETKDQSYVLYTLTQAQLAHIAFPLGEMRKTNVRSIAEDSGFCNAQKPDSQDICFVPDGNYAAVVSLHSGKAPVPGDFADKQGNVLGRHRGIVNYTVGQRRGLGISSAEPYYVCKICPENNTVLLGRKEDLMKSDVALSDFNWISGETPSGKIRCKAKIRYRQTEQWAYAEADGNGTVHLHFDEPQRAPTPGQAAVLYDGETVLGGGVIM